MRAHSPDVRQEAQLAALRGDDPAKAVSREASRERRHEAREHATDPTTLDSIDPGCVRRVF